MSEIISDATILEATPGWSVIDGRLERSFRGDNFGAGGDFVAAIGHIADGQNHHPDIELTYPGVARVMLTTHAAGGLTQLDIDLAVAINAEAEARGLTSP